MLILPAIDLKGGKCVRLYQGEMDSAKIYSDAPEEIAKRWQSMGARMLHVVDLDGAVAGEPRNLGAISRILQNVSIPIQLGGGIRSLQTIEDYLKLGVSRVILGTVAYQNSELVRQACAEARGRVAVGIDAKGGLVAVQGWQEVTEKRALDLAMELQDAGVAAIIYTDIARDGALTGPNLQATAELAEAISIPVILSGGMHSHEDLITAAALEEKGVRAVILGRSLYEGTIDLAKAIDAVQRPEDTP